MNIYQETSSPRLGHRCTHRLWEEREGRDRDGSSRTQLQKRQNSEIQRGKDKRGQEWQAESAKGRAEGWAVLTRPWAAAITLLGEQIQAPTDLTVQNA